MSTPPLLVVEHEAQCPPGWMGEWLAEAGLVVDVRRPYAGDTLPSDLVGHAGMVVLGGEMGAYDDADHPWLTDVKQLCRTAVATGAPRIGIALANKLLAVGMGGLVAPGPHGQQIGVLDVGWTPEAYVDPLLAPVTALDDTPAVQWNNDVVTRLPDDAVALARTPRGELQAARFGSAAWGVQWHPEAGVDIIAPWAEHDRDDAVERGVDVDAYVEDVAAAGERLRRTWRVLADGFADVCRARVPDVAHR